jgi:hypothetical protein
MALARFVLTNTVTVPQGTPTADSNGFWARYLGWCGWCLG